MPPPRADPGPNGRGDRGDRHRLPRQSDRRKGWEGLIAKRADAPYTAGRSRDWRKFKCSAEQELVIAPLRQDRSPFADEVRERGATWVEPRLLAQVGFSEWTRDGRLRHPPLPRAARRQGGGGGGGPRGSAEAVVVGRRRVAISHPDRVLFPDPGLAKLDLARHYAAVGEVMVPHVRGRPLALQSFPQGVGGDGYFVEDAPGHFPDWITTVTVPKREGGTINQVLADDVATLVYLAGQNAITPHVWTSRATNH